MAAGRLKLAVVYDVDGWAYHRRARALVRYAPDDFSVESLRAADAGTTAWPWTRFRQFDVCFLIEYAAAQLFRQQFRRHGTNIPLVVSHNSDADRRRNLWDAGCAAADFVIANNAGVWEAHGRRTGTCCISNGVDRELFFPTGSVSDRPQRVFWRGSGSPAKGKGWASILEPSIEPLRRLGFDPDFAAIDCVARQRLPTDALVERYRHSSYVVCTSRSEGTPNYLLEAVSCGAVAVSTRVGNLREWGRDRENCVFIPRSIEGLLDGLQYARAHRSRLSQAGLDAIRGWHYGGPEGRAQWFFQLFRRIVRDGPGRVAPFHYAETHWSDL